MTELKEGSPETESADTTPPAAKAAVKPEPKSSGWASGEGLQVQYRGRLWVPALLLLPTLIVVAVFLYYPMGRTAWLSFHRVAFLGRRVDFAGLENYVQLFTDPGYLQVIIRTVVLSSIIVALSLTAALFLASLLNMHLAGRRVYRLLMIWPLALSTAISGLIFLVLFNPNFGLVNQVLAPFGIQPDWLRQPLLAQSVVVMAVLWNQVGYNLVFYVAAYRNLPGEVMEAALIDGASAWQRFRYVTFPLLAPMTIFLLVTTTSFAFFDIFALIDVMTGGGPTGATTVMIYDIYRNAFEFRRTGPAAAQSLLLFVTVIVLTVLQLRESAKRAHYDV